MKIFQLSLFTVIFLKFSIAQNLYLEKFGDCHLTSFCLDCGDKKAQPPKSFLNELKSNINTTILGKIKGSIEIQLLIDEKGKPCILSALNESNISSKKLKLEETINNTSIWEPAISGSKKENSSVSLILEFKNGNIVVKRREFDNKNQSNGKSVGTPHIKGTDKNKLNKTWTLYTQENSELPWDMSRAIINDYDNSIWIGTDNGIVKIDNDNWYHFNSKNTIISSTAYDKNKTKSVRDMAVDKFNNKWFIIGWSVYKYDNNNWIQFDSTNSPIKWENNIYIDHSNNVWFTSSHGITKFDGHKWSEINTQNSNLPSDKTLGVYVDLKNRLWVGTFEGNVIIENGKLQLINDTNSPLSKAYISKIFEDKNRNMWFALNKTKSTDAGIFKLDSTDKWERIKHPNADIFSENSINDFLLDEDNNLLWITLNGIGVLCYNLIAKKWEIYTNENSNIPSIHCEKITKDKVGSIWIATYSGVVKLNK